VIPGIDLSEFMPSLRWNITKTEAINSIRYYKCCEEPYIGKLEPNWIKKEIEL